MKHLPACVWFSCSARARRTVPLLKVRLRYNTCSSYVTTLWILFSGSLVLLELLKKRQEYEASVEQTVGSKTCMCARARVCMCACVCVLYISVSVCLCKRLFIGNIMHNCCCCCKLCNAFVLVRTRSLLLCYYKRKFSIDLTITETLSTMFADHNIFHKTVKSYFIFYTLTFVTSTPPMFL